MNFEKLTSHIQQTNDFLQQNAVKAVNRHITLRNWLIGFYIVEFEQKGNDRAQYGNKLIAELAKAIKIKGLAETNLKLCRQFYNTYPQILGLSTQKIHEKNAVITIGQSATDQSPDKDNYLYTFVFSTSFTHLVELIKIDDPTKRHFYELLILKT